MEFLKKSGTPVAFILAVAYDMKSMGNMKQLVIFS